MTEKFLKKEGLDALIKSVRGSGGRFVGPTTDARQVVYKEITKAGDLADGYILPRNSYKEWVFPQTEVIARYRIKKDGVELRAEDIEDKETVIFGARPCEAASLASLRSVFTWDSIDETYTRREDNIVVMTVPCTRADDDCFCTTVGLSPESTEGSDVILTETEEGGYLATTITERGASFIEANKATFTKKSKDAKPRELASPEKIAGVDLERINERLASTDCYDDPVWAELTRKCCGCGACTFACPTCHCFDITDEGTAYEGERRKNWDACQFEHFTLHASGHNPRDTQYKRYRNRFMCKFNFYPNKFSSVGCVGCGRCIRVCPVRLDITEVMEGLSK